MKRRMDVAIIGLSGCSGCQLPLLGREYLPAVCTQLSIRCFPLCGTMMLGRVDAVLVEGAVDAEEDVPLLREIRQRANHLIAFGTCAVHGGVARSARLRPVSDFVVVDTNIPGCPPEAQQTIEALQALAWNIRPHFPTHPVCLDCRMAENPCVLLMHGLPCVGPVTQGGCGGRCPSFGLPCDGCRGPVAEANYEEQSEQLARLGLTPEQVRQRMTLFAGEDGDA